MADATPTKDHQIPTKQRPTLLHILVRIMGWPLVAILFLFTMICLFVVSGRLWIAPIILLMAAFAVVFLTRRLRWFATLTLACLIGIFIFVSFRTPQKDRNWDEALSVMPRITVEGSTLTIENLRNFNWRSRQDFDARWETRSYNLDNLRSVEMILQPLPLSDLASHTMLSFDFGPDGWLLLTIEARRIKGQPWGPVAGLLNEYELIYLFTDERDALGIRGRQNLELVSYPTVTDPLWRRAFLLSLCATSNSLANRPRFYNTLRDNCTTEWIRAVDKLSGRIWGVQLETVLNGGMGRLIHRTGAMDTDLQYEQARKHFRIDQRILEHLDDPDFSNLIRKRDTPSTAESFFPTSHRSVDQS